jgi:hypothetical protein
MVVTIFQRVEVSRKVGQKVDEVGIETFEVRKRNLNFIYNRRLIHRLILIAQNLPVKKTNLSGLQIDLTHPLSDFAPARLKVGKPALT